MKKLILSILALIFMTVVTYSQVSGILKDNKNTIKWYLVIGDEVVYLEGEAQYSNDVPNAIEKQAKYYAIHGVAPDIVPVGKITSQYEKVKQRASLNPSIEIEIDTTMFSIYELTPLSDLRHYTFDVYHYGNSYGHLGLHKLRDIKLKAEWEEYEYIIISCVEIPLRYRASFNQGKFILGQEMAYPDWLEKYGQQN